MKGRIFITCLVIVSFLCHELVWASGQDKLAKDTACDDPELISAWDTLTGTLAGKSRAGGGTNTAIATRGMYKASEHGKINRKIRSDIKDGRYVSLQAAEYRVCIEKGKDADAPGGVQGKIYEVLGLLDPEIIELLGEITIFLLPHEDAMYPYCLRTESIDGRIEYQVAHAGSDKGKGKYIFMTQRAFMELPAELVGRILRREARLAAERHNGIRENGGYDEEVAGILEEINKPQKEGKKKKAKKDWAKLPPGPERELGLYLKDKFSPAVVDKLVRRGLYFIKRDVLRGGASVSQLAEYLAILEKNGLKSRRQRPVMLIYSKGALFRAWGNSGDIVGCIPDLVVLKEGSAYEGDTGYLHLKKHLSEFRDVTEEEMLGLLVKTIKEGLKEDYAVKREGKGLLRVISYDLYNEKTEQVYKVILSEDCTVMTFYPENFRDCGLSGILGISKEETLRLVKFLTGRIPVRIEKHLPNPGFIEDVIIGYYRNRTRVLRKMRRNIYYFSNKDGSEKYIGVWNDTTKEMFIMDINGVVTGVVSAGNMEGFDRIDITSKINEADQHYLKNNEGLKRRLFFENPRAMELFPVNNRGRESGRYYFDGIVVNEERFTNPIDIVREAGRMIKGGSGMFKMEVSGIEDDYAAIGYREKYFVVRKKLLDLLGYSEEEFKTHLTGAVERQERAREAITVKTGLEFDNLPEVVVVELMRASPYMGANCAGDGWIGVNECLGRMPDKEFRDIVFESVLLHELWHEANIFSGERDAAPLDILFLFWTIFESGLTFDGFEKVFRLFIDNRGIFDNFLFIKNEVIRGLMGRMAGDVPSLRKKSAEMLIRLGRKFDSKTGFIFPGDMKNWLKRHGLLEGGEGEEPAQPANRIVYLGEDISSDTKRFGLKGASFKMLRDASRVLFPDRDEDIFPPGFIIDSESVRLVAGSEDIPDVFYRKILDGVSYLETKTKRRFGGGGNPLFVSVRSSPEYSMPGQLDTILNIGMTNKTVEALLQDKRYDERAVWSMYRRFIGNFGAIVMGAKIGCTEEELSVADEKALIGLYKEIIRRHTGKSFPEDDAMAQLKMSLRAIAGLWNKGGAADYRRYEGIPDSSGMALIVESVVFGNLNSKSGAGVLFSREPVSGKASISLQFALGRQGPAIVSGRPDESSIDILRDNFPDAYKNLVNIAGYLERKLAEAVDIEFTIENGRLYILQVRPASLSVFAELRVLEDFIKEGILDNISRADRLERLQKRIRRRRVFRVKEGVERQDLFQGRVLSPGAVYGQLVFSKERFEELASLGIPVVLAVNYRNRDNFIDVIRHSRRPVGIICDYGNELSHESQISRKLQVPAVINPEGVHIYEDYLECPGGRRIGEGTFVLLDGDSGVVSLCGDTGCLVEDKGVWRMSFDVDIDELRRRFVKEGGGHGYTFSRLLEMNMAAWKAFLEAEEEERKRPDDILLQKETFVRNLYKMFLHELLARRGRAEGMDEDEIKRRYDEYIYNREYNSYRCEVISEKAVPVDEWEGSKADEIAGGDPCLVRDVYKRYNPQQRLEYVFVLIKPIETEKPVSVFSCLPPELLTSPPVEEGHAYRQAGMPVFPMITSDDGVHINFVMGDYAVRNGKGEIVYIKDDYWSQDEIGRRLSDIERAVRRRFGGDIGMQTHFVERRGHRRKANGIVRYSVWFTKRTPLRQKEMERMRRETALFELRTIEGNKESLDALRKRIKAMCDEIPGIYIDEYAYSYKVRDLFKERRIFTIRKRDVPPGEIDKLRRDIEEAYFKAPVNIRDFAYWNGDLYQIVFPLYEEDEEKIVKDMVSKGGVCLRDEEKRLAIEGFRILLSFLNERGLNLPDGKRKEEDFAEGGVNIEIINNLRGWPGENSSSLLKGHPFIFGLRDRDDEKFNDYYKKTIVVSLAWLLQLGENGCTDELAGEIRTAVEETRYGPEDKIRSVREVLRHGRIGFPVFRGEVMHELDVCS